MSRGEAVTQGRGAGRWKPPKINRDQLLLIAGLVGTGYETIAARVDRPYLLALFGGMMGLPFFLGKDERSQKSKDRK